MTAGATSNAPSPSSPSACPAPCGRWPGLAFNYRWSWTCGGAALFRDIDPAQWEHGRGNPRAMIEMVPPHRLQALAADAAYVARLDSLVARIEADLRRPPADVGVAADRPVAYCCSEFGVHGSLPISTAAASECWPATC